MSPFRKKHLLIFILSFLAAFQGCALLAPEGNRVTEEQKNMTGRLLSDWRENGKSVVMKDRFFGYEPENFKASTCYGESRFQKYELDKISEGHYTLGTLAYYCPAEKQYWINQHSGGTIFINRWAGPFPYKTVESVSADSQE